MKKNLLGLFAGLIFLIVLSTSVYQKNVKETGPLVYSGESAYHFVEQQLAFGPRISGSPSNLETGNWISNTLQDFGWEVEFQEGSLMGLPIRNIVAKNQENSFSVGKPWIIIGAHYDSRSFADKDLDPTAQQEPVPGANDGASGVAVLLEIARVLPKQFPGNLWLVFFDAEDNGQISGWEWIMGSTLFVKQLDGKPDYVIIVDMIGDKDLNIYMEKNSAPLLTGEIWAEAAKLGHADIFIPVPKYRMLDDHIPFTRTGINTTLIIDFDYPYWHTTQDTADKVSPESLQVVGDTLIAWLSKFIQ